MASEMQMYFVNSLSLESQPCFFFYMVPTAPYALPPLSQSNPDSSPSLPPSSPSPSQTDKLLPLQRIETCESFQGLGARRAEEVDLKLSFRVEWKNENRNIVPNLVNQMMSFLLKRGKSQKLVGRLLRRFGGEGWSVGRFYQYMRKIKESVTHYLNETILPYFMQIHQPNCDIYSMDEQLLFMRVCRAALLSFLRSDAVLNALTSARMSTPKRTTHLIARHAILQKFNELAHQALP